MRKLKNVYVYDNQKEIDRNIKCILLKKDKIQESKGIYR